MSLSREIAPSRMIRGGVTVTSTTVDSLVDRNVPASRIKGIFPENTFNCDERVADILPDLFADVVASGTPECLIRFLAKAYRGIRNPRLPCFVSANVDIHDALKISVRGPGQK